MTNTLSVYFSPWHWRAEDVEYIHRLDPAWVRIHQPTARAIQTVQQAAPNAKIMLRSWDIDDHNGDRKREMYADPKGAAARHLNLWRAKWQELEQELRRNGWTLNTDNWHIGLVNEPDPAHVRQVVEYSQEAMRLVQGTQIRLGVGVSSVGNFSKPSENDQGWTQFIPLEKPINDGGHILIVHEYWQPEGPTFGEDAGNLAWRHQHIPLDVPILIGEAGANGYIYGRHSQHDDAGWQKFMGPDQYAAQVKEYIEGCDQRVKGVCLYMTDFHSDQWWSFDTMPAMHQLLAIKDTRPRKASPFAATKPPVDTHLPVVGTGPKPTDPIAYVIALAGANIRSAPNADTAQVLIAVPYREQVRIVGVEENGWFRVRYRDHTGYMHGQLVGVEEPEPLPSPVVPQPTGDSWQRSYAFVRRWEGGWVNDPNDPGGATNKGITIGTFTRWRQSQGKPQPTVEELRNISDAEVEAIYRAWYWQASGADKLPWPLCLATFDTAVNAGVGRAEEMLQKSGGDFMAYVGHVGIWYTTLNGFEHFGRAWARRRFDLLIEASK